MRRSAQERFWAKVERGESCWIWTANRINRRVGGGYGQFTICNNGVPKKLLAHRLSFEMAFGEIPQNLVVCHRCDNPPCVRPDHLFLGNLSDNMQDMLKKNRQRYVGPRNRKLSDRDVLEIRELRINGAKLEEIAGRYGVSFSYVSAVARGLDRSKLSEAFGFDEYRRDFVGTRSEAP